MLPVCDSSKAIAFPDAVLIEMTQANQTAQDPACRIDHALLVVQVSLDPLGLGMVGPAGG